MNLIDGLDGLAAGVGLFGVATTFVLAAMRGDPIMMLFMAALGGALVGFLFYNFNPASIFMGDTGSMFLGYVLAVGAVQTSQKSSTTVAILVPIVALGVPIADTLLAMLRRALRHRPMFSADRAHIHHKLLDLGLTQKQAVLVLYGVSILLGGTALLLTVASSVQSAVLLAAMGVLGFLGIRKLGYGQLSARPPPGRGRHPAATGPAGRGRGRRAPVARAEGRGAGLRLERDSALADLQQRERFRSHPARARRLEPGWRHRRLRGQGQPRWREGRIPRRCQDRRRHARDRQASRGQRLHPHLRQRARSARRLPPAPRQA